MKKAKEMDEWVERHLRRPCNPNYIARSNKLAGEKTTSERFFFYEFHVGTVGGMSAPATTYE